METYKNIVSDELQNELLQISEMDTTNAFRVGEITDIVLAQAVGLKTHKSEVYRAVSSFAGRSARTIREYHTVWKFYPSEVRAIYPTLKYDHFRVAMRLGDRWKEALDWAANQVDELNRPATVDAMIKHYEGLFVGVEEQDIIKVLRDYLGKFKSILYSVPFARDAADKLKVLCDELEKLLDEQVESGV